ncbi:YfdX family protein [Roseibacterium sp. SDUM158016]|uniref:YfdX family protein n=1 Tax=Roseicyclus sediminis TaxID=2980997 RepID=UPI0021CF2C00|nr:YfdX family protein [Roseibacterium sp. SDUM158016]MCU4653295.1 YfdX family protein [Roseibacterium sp. SDUM158016]
MTTGTRLAAAVLAALMTTTAFPALATPAATPATATPAYETQAEMLRTADVALHAVIRARAARLALFENDIEGAKARIAEAMAEFTEAESTFNDLVLRDTEDPANAARYLPFDMSMALTETFTDTEENRQALQEAAGLMQSGAQDEAVQVLRLAQIDVNVSAAMLPVLETSESLARAQAMIDNGQFFEANLALKDVEDSILVRSFSIDAIPLQGSAH